MGFKKIESSRISIETRAGSSRILEKVLASERKGVLGLHGHGREVLVLYNVASQTGRKATYGSSPGEPRS